MRVDMGIAWVALGEAGLLLFSMDVSVALCGDANFKSFAAAALRAAFLRRCFADFDSGGVLKETSLLTS
jgi:hypothetical protein